MNVNKKQMMAENDRYSTIQLMRGRKANSLLLLVAVLLSFCLGRAWADEVAQRLYLEHSSSIYRIDVVTLGSEKKASLGTGFVIGRENVLASNFHVIASAVHEPDRYKLEWRSIDGRRGPLQIIGVDVVHDLALLQAEDSMGAPFTTRDLPEKGTELYSLGHPLALDLSIVDGTVNGMMENSIYEKIHFSGNINPGMSGGPTLDTEGHVVGINVASAGDAVGFLVPAKYLDALLLKNSQFTPKDHDQLITSIGEQLLSNQEILFDELMAGEWPMQRVGNFTVPDQISSRLDCWGNLVPEDERVKFREISAECTGQDSIYLSSRQRAGTVSYQYFWLDSESLLPRSFYWLYQNRHNSRFIWGPNEDDVGNFTCSTEFVEVSGQSFKANVCARPYKRYPELTDFMVLMAMTGHGNEGFMFTLDLSTVTLDNAMILFQRFLENFSWQPRES